MGEKVYALLSVTNKDGIDVLANGLRRHNFEILSTGGTADALEKVGIPIIRVEDFTGMKESKLLKTMHHYISGGIFYSDNSEESKEFRELLGLIPIGIVANNFYVSDSSMELEEFLGNVDVGGPTMTRTAAKMGLLKGSVAILTDPSQYELVLYDLDRYREIKRDLINALAVVAFRKLEDYNAGINSFLADHVENSSGWARPLKGEGE